LADSCDLSGKAKMRLQFADRERGPLGPWAPRQVGVGAAVLVVVDGDPIGVERGEAVQHRTGGSVDPWSPTNSSGSLSPPRSPKLALVVARFPAPLIWAVELMSAMWPPRYSSGPKRAFSPPNEVRSVETGIPAKGSNKTVALYRSGSSWASVIESAISWALVVPQ